MKNIPRLFVTDGLSEGHPVLLPEYQAHYLARVMRLGGGDMARLFNGVDGEWRAELMIEGRKVSAHPVERLRPQPEAPLGAPKLLFAPLKKTRTDFTVEKATELGVSEIFPVMTERTQTRRVKIDRLQSLIVEASEQTERMDVPMMHAPRSLADHLEHWPEAETLIFCDEAGNDADAVWGRQAGRASTILQALGKGSIRAGGLLIGPEGGFSQKEREDLRAHRFVLPVTLGPSILRAETATIAALTIWQALLGDWQ